MAKAKRIIYINAEFINIPIKTVDAGTLILFSFKGKIFLKVLHGYALRYQLI
jgi:hypothetical protein